MPRFLRLHFIVILGVLISPSILFAQSQDSLNTIDTSVKSLHSPHKATVLSLALPGAGQFYNKKYWKIPIVYGALAASGYYFYDFNQQVKTQNAYFTSLYAQNSQPTVFEIEQRDNDRVSRDVAGIAFVVIYVLQVVDATVDAHFFEFNIDQNLGVNLLRTPEYALNFTFKIP